MGEPDHDDWNGSYIGNVTMMLERDNKEGDWIVVEKRKENRRQQKAETQSTGSEDRKHEDKLCNRFQVLHNEIDDENDDDENESQEDNEEEAKPNATSCMKTSSCGSPCEGLLGGVPAKHRAKDNQRQRKRKREAKAIAEGELLQATRHRICIGNGMAMGSAMERSQSVMGLAAASDGEKSVSN